MIWTEVLILKYNLCICLLEHKDSRVPRLQLKNESPFRNQIRIILIVVYMYLVRDTRSLTCTGHLINRESHLRVGDVKSNI